MTELEIKDAVRECGGYRCAGCGVPQAEYRRTTGRKLDVHRKEPDSAYTVEGCIAVCRDCHGKEHKKINGTSEGRAAVRIASDLMEMARFICQHTKCNGRRLKIGAYLDSVLREPVMAKYSAVIDRVTEEAMASGD